MFSSRKRATAPPLTKETANPNAATAAASAFVRRGSNASLSSAAAAAALKARPTTPTNVAEVQSKRALRRSPSVASATGRDTSRRRELARSPSVGSMMERTFRSPSPGRSPAPRRHEVPPVPSLPDTDSLPSKDATATGQRKGAALQTQTFRTASEKMKDGQRGSWFGAATARDPAVVRRTSSALQLSSHQPPEPRPGSVSPSINFSYPRARMQSPSGSLRSLQTDDRTLVYDANSRRMVPKGDLIARSQSVREPVDEIQPKKKKKKAQQELDRTGSHLAKGTLGRTKAPALDNNGADIEADSCLDTRQEPVAMAQKPQKKTKTKKKKAVEEWKQGPAADGILASPVATVPPVDTVTPASSVPDHIETGNKMNGKAKPPASKANGKAPAARVHSESPARSARFASSTDQLVVRHEPPPRSLSPRKSAMKHASPSRGVSPSDDGSEASAPALSSSQKDDMARKKSARVSWDDRSTVVVSEPSQQQIDPVISGSPSPQSKKPWLNITGKGGKKDVPSVDEDETMSPRPALPSFGSVREKKSKDQEERPLVRPQEHVVSPLPSADTDEAAIQPTGENGPRGADEISSILPSIEGAGDVSSSDGSLMEDTSDDEVDASRDGGSGAIATGTASALTDSTPDNTGDQVPSISVSQPSPRPSDHETQAAATGEAKESQPSTIDAEQSDESVSDSDEDDSEYVAALPTASLMDDIVEEEEEGDTYSDAYENMTEVDGDGFMSLDAVLESPAASPKGKKSVDIEPKEVEAAAPKAAVAGAEAASPPDDWENAKAYWKSLSLEKRRQLEEEAELEATHDTKPKSPGKKKAAESGQASQEKSVTKNGRVYQIQPGTTLEHEGLSEAVNAASEVNAATDSSVAPPQLRQSLRNEQNDVSNSTAQSAGMMRKSMRSDRPLSPVEGITQRRADAPAVGAVTGTRMKKSLRQNSVDLDTPERRPSIKATERPASYHPSTADTMARAHKRNRSVDTAPLPSATGIGSSVKPTLRRRGSDSSESSFTRMRSGSGGAKEFRRSMRGSMRDPPATADGSQNANRFSLRPGSPDMDFRRNSVSSLPAGAGTGIGRMRQSLRGESVDRNSRKRMSAFSKSPANKDKRSKSVSRFVDSSDEDDEPAGIFSSRFADSSSDEDTRPVSKGRGMPKSLRSKTSKRATASAIDLRPHGGFDAANSSEQEDGIPHSKRSQVATAGQLQRNRSGRGPLMPLPAPAFASGAGDESFRPSSSRRGSFMSILRRKKDSSAKVTRPEVAESAARRDTHLERTANELEMVRSSNGDEPSWPLPEPAGGSGGDGGEGVAVSLDIDRPSTAGGPIRSPAAKSKFLRRRSASQGTTPVGPDPFAAGASPLKKKKFGALRKMFGLHD